MLVDWPRPAALLSKLATALALAALCAGPPLAARTAGDDDVRPPTTSPSPRERCR